MTHSEQNVEKILFDDGVPNVNTTTSKSFKAGNVFSVINESGMD